MFKRIQVCVCVYVYLFVCVCMGLPVESLCVCVCLCVYMSVNSLPDQFLNSINLSMDSRRSVLSLHPGCSDGTWKLLVLSMLV